MATFDLPGATGSDVAGQAGIDGDVDRHFFRSFGAALLLGVLADQVTRVAALPNGGTSGQGGVSATGQVFIDTARAELERHKSIPPTVTVDEGSRINVEVAPRHGVRYRVRKEPPMKRWRLHAALQWVIGRSGDVPGGATRSLRRG